ncbi:hypothetical protein DL93DRAFT_2156962 [Clavulina sp. PMI_390]|nr:hypothetical protein DL93DRAFT_2156962 [Clavulina sp. PMI_390]
MSITYPRLYMIYLVDLTPILLARTPEARRTQVRELDVALADINQSKALLNSLRTTISAIEAKLDSLRDRVASPLSVLSAVPDEILAEIFVHAAESCKSPRASTMQALTLSHVSGRWKDVSLRTARLWSVVAIEAAPQFPLIVPLFGARSRHFRCKVFFETIPILPGSLHTIEDKDPWPPNSMVVEPSFADVISEFHFHDRASFWALVVRDDASSLLSLDCIHMFGDNVAMAPILRSKPHLFQTPTLSITYSAVLLQGLENFPYMTKLIIHDIPVTHIPVLSQIRAPLLMHLELSNILAPLVIIFWAHPDESLTRNVFMVAMQLESLSIHGPSSFAVLDVIGWTQNLSTSLPALRSLRLKVAQASREPMDLEDNEETRSDALMLREILSRWLQAANLMVQTANDDTLGLLEQLAISSVLVGEHAAWYAERVAEFSVMN